MSGELATTFDPAELEAQEAKVLRHAVAYSLGINRFHVRLLLADGSSCSDQTILNPLPAEIALFLYRNQNIKSAPRWRDDSCSIPCRMEISKLLRRCSCDPWIRMPGMAMDVHYCKLLRFVTNCKCSIFSLKLELQQTLWALHIGEARRYMTQLEEGMGTDAPDRI